MALALLAGLSFGQMKALSRFKPPEGTSESSMGFRLSIWRSALDALGPGGLSRDRAGFEVRFDDEPADILAELLKACAGQVADIGGIWKVRVAAGPAGYAVFELGANLPRRLAQPSFEQPVFLSAVTANEQTAVLVGGDTLISVPWSTPDQPERLPAQTYQGVLSLAVAQDDILIGLANGEILRAPATPPIDQSLGKIPSRIPGPLFDLAIGSEALYIAAGEAGFATLSTGFPQGLTTTLALDGSASALELSPDAGRAYVAAGEGGLQIIDLSEPLSPTLERSIDTPGSALDLAIQADGLVLVADRDGLQIIDPTGDANPVGAYIAPPGSFVQAVASSGARAYLADRFGVIVLDLRDPTNPQPIATITGFSAYNTQIINGNLYVAPAPTACWCSASSTPINHT
ncbi:MAG: hypothetical protein HC822_16215 [Oscillochloris sp.]|nr:hypothetical protein [Oscillochloris sp.]